MPSKKSPSIRVRGTCTSGHVTEAMSDPGRITWNGECSHDGCTKQVRAKRIPADSPAANDTSNVGTAEPADDDDPHRVIEVPAHEHRSQGSQPAPEVRSEEGDEPASGPVDESVIDAGTGRSDDGAGGGVRPAGGADGAGGADAGGGDGDAGGTGVRRSRRDRRRERRDAREAERSKWRVPGIIPR